MIGNFLTRQRTLLVAVAALAVAASGSSWAASITLDVAEDTEITTWPNWINDARGLLTPSDPPSYFGGVLRVAQGAFPNGAYAGTGNVGEVLMRWDLSGLPGNAQITNATLRMIQFDGAVDITNVQRIDQGIWTEAGTSWNSWVAQTTSSTLLGGMLGVPAGSGGVTLFSNPALTSTVQGWHDGSTSNLGLILKWAGPNDDGDTYASRESTSADAPQLILEYVQVPEPGTASLLFMSAGALACGRRRR